MVLVATGRSGNTKGLALEKIGIQWGHFIQTTPELRIRGSEFSNIYAIGDVNGLLLFDSSAHAQARVAIQNILGKPTTFNLHLVPVSANTHPPVAFMGCTEPEVKASGDPYEIVTEELVADGKRNLVKMLYHPGTRRFLSCLAIGPDSNEIVGRAAFMLSTNMPTESWLNVSAAYPSAGEDLVRALQRRFDAWEAFGSGFVEEKAQEELPTPREFPYHIWPRDYKDVSRNP
jgi:dihydrolipoamide dehydrogenase